MIKLETVTVYDVKDLAKMLHKKPNTIRNYIRSGNLEGQKVGASWYVTDETLTKFLTGKDKKKIK